MGIPFGVVAQMLDCGIVVIFTFIFWLIDLQKGVYSLIP